MSCVHGKPGLQLLIITFQEKHGARNVFSFSFIVEDSRLFLYFFFLNVDPDIPQMRKSVLESLLNSKCTIVNQCPSTELNTH